MYQTLSLRAPKVTCYSTYNNKRNDLTIIHSYTNNSIEPSKPVSTKIVQEMLKKV